MRNKFNWIVRVVIMAIITAEVLAACGVRPEDRESRARAALEQKYHKEFEITQVYPQKFGEMYYEVQAYAVDDLQVRFSAAIDTEDENISDSYVERSVCTAIAQKAEENLDQMPGIYYLSVFAGGPQPYTEDPNISIQDYAALDTLNVFQVELLITPDGKDSEGLYNSLGSIFNGMECLSGVIRLYLVNAEQMEAAQIYLDANDRLHSEYLELTRDFFRLEIPYQKGVLGMSGQEFTNTVKEAL